MGLKKWKEDWCYPEFPGSPGGDLFEGQSWIVIKCLLWVMLCKRRVSWTRRHHLGVEAHPRMCTSSARKDPEMVNAAR